MKRLREQRRPTCSAPRRAGLARSALRRECGAAARGAMGAVVFRGTTRRTAAVAAGSGQKGPPRDRARASAAHTHARLGNSVVAEEYMAQGGRCYSIRSDLSALPPSVIADSASVPSGVPPVGSRVLAFSSGGRFQ